MLTPGTYALPRSARMSKRTSRSSGPSASTWASAFQTPVLGMRRTKGKPAETSSSISRRTRRFASAEFICLIPPEDEGFLFLQHEGQLLRRLAALAETVWTEFGD